MFRCPASMMLIFILASAASGTVFVDDDGSGNFTKIQEAINASEIGDVIVVQNGTYPENLVVDRSVVLKGEENPVVKGSGLSDPLVTITSEKVTLEGITFTGSLNDSSDFGAVLVLADGCKILNNTISGSSGHGLCLRDSRDHIISGNLIQDSLKVGIRLDGANFSRLTANEIYRNKESGIFMENSQQNWVSDNGVWRNGADGIVIFTSLRTELTSNAIHNNSENGVYLSEANNSALMGNRIRDNDGSGIYLDMSLGTFIVMNTIERCTEMGIHADLSDNNVILRNTVNNNDLDGIGLHSSNFNTISENVVQKNRDNGISLRQNSYWCQITLNEIFGNKRYGLIFDESSSNFAQGNEIRNNSDGITMRYSSDNSLIENKLDHNIVGMSIEFGQNVIVSTNEIRNSTRDGINLLRCDNSKIWANKIIESKADGVHMVRSTGTVVSSNDIEKSGEYGVQLLDSSDQNLFILNRIQNSDLGGIYIFEGEFNLLSSNALIENGKFNARDNGGNMWLTNFYSDYPGEKFENKMIGDEPYEILGKGDAINLDQQPFMNYQVLLGR
jgi:parallel beta-helix repeat protein